MPAADRTIPQSLTLEGHFISCTTNEQAGKQVTTAVYKDSAGHHVHCVWRDSEGFYLQESETYKISGKVEVRDGKRYLFEPTITIVNDEPTVVPHFAQSPVRKKIDWGAVFAVLFWGGLIFWGIASYSPSTSSTSNEEAGNTASSITDETAVEDFSDSATLDDSSDSNSYLDSDESDYSDDSGYGYDSDDSSYDDYSYDGYTNSAGDYVPSPSYSGGSSIGGYSPSALCGDGTYSYSQSRSGTCSHHGGVSSWY